MLKATGPLDMNMTLGGSTAFEAAAKVRVRLRYLLWKRRETRTSQARPGQAEVLRA